MLFCESESPGILHHRDSTRVLHIFLVAFKQMNTKKKKSDTLCCPKVNLMIGSLGSNLHRFINGGQTS